MKWIFFFLPFLLAFSFGTYPHEIDVTADASFVIINPNAFPIEYAIDASFIDEHQKSGVVHPQSVERIQLRLAEGHAGDEVVVRASHGNSVASIIVETKSPVRVPWLPVGVCVLFLAIVVLAYWLWRL